MDPAGNPTIQAGKARPHTIECMRREKSTDPNHLKFFCIPEVNLDYGLPIDTPGPKSWGNRGILKIRPKNFALGDEVVMFSSLFGGWRANKPTTWLNNDADFLEVHPIVPAADANGALTDMQYTVKCGNEVDFRGNGTTGYVLLGPVSKFTHCIVTGESPASWGSTALYANWYVVYSESFAPSLDDKVSFDANGVMQKEYTDAYRMTEDLADNGLVRFRLHPDVPRIEIKQTVTSYQGMEFHMDALALVRKNAPQRFSRTEESAVQTSVTEPCTCLPLDDMRLGSGTTTMHECAAYASSVLRPMERAVVAHTLSTTTCPSGSTHHIPSGECMEIARQMGRPLSSSLRARSPPTAGANSATTLSSSTRTPSRIAPRATPRAFACRSVARAAMRVTPSSSTHRRRRAPRGATA